MCLFLGTEGTLNLFDIGCFSSNYCGLFLFDWGVKVVSGPFRWRAERSVLVIVVNDPFQESNFLACFFKFDVVWCSIWTILSFNFFLSDRLLLFH